MIFPLHFTKDVKEIDFIFSHKSEPRALVTSEV